MTCLPGAELVWRCPYIILFTSDDGTVGGEGYCEYNLIKMCGENNGSNEYSESRFTMKRTDRFRGWEEWRAANKAGLECDILTERKGNRIVLRTENSGVSMECVTTVNEVPDKTYLALTGDEVVLTDIRIN
ncbi:MAG: hypothetical protein K6F54_05650 [Lachnospiraceae bacterium]|nr:hypothetical protein [Lachnospiraceae bacterium]